MSICKKMVFNGLAVGKKSLTADFAARSFQCFSSNLSAKSFDTAKEKAELFNSLPIIIEDLASHPKYREVPEARDWMKRVIDGTVTGGKIARAVTAVMAYKMLEKPENVTEKSVLQAQALGWCVELAYCVVLDDIADGSLTRRGRPCWYRREDVGLANAVNDSVLINACIHHILKNYFANSSIYIRLYETINETLLYTSIGQFLDIRGSENKNNYESFTKENYDAIVKHKSAYYTYKLPVTLGMILANRLNDESMRNCEDITLPLGRLFQIQDDYIDCFGDEAVTGKMGTDIQEAKCTWLAVTALPLCSAKDRAVFKACYGSKEPAHVERIKQLYVQLKIPEIFKQEEQNVYDTIIKKIDSIPSSSERSFYKFVLDLTYKRKK